MDLFPKKSRLKKGPPESLRDHSQRVPGTTPRGSPGPLPEGPRDHSQRVPGTSPVGSPGVLWEA